MKLFYYGLLGAALATAAPALGQKAPAKKPAASAASAASKAAAPAAAPKETPPSGGTPRDFQLPAKEDFTLDNGLKARLVPFGQVPKVTMLVCVQAGNVHESADQVGIADLLGKLLREGTSTLSATEVADKIARMGGSLDISVGPDQTQLWASCLSEYAPELATLVADVVQHPSLPATELPRIKTDFKRRMALLRAEPSFQARMKFQQAVYGNHPYGRPLPTDAQIDALTLEQAKAFYAQQYGAQRTAVFVAGKFDAPALREAITKAWSAWPQGPAPRIEVAKAQIRPDLLTQDRPGAPQSTLILGTPVVDPAHPDYMRVRVTNSLLGGSFGSRITRNIREDKGYTYSPYSYLDVNYRTATWQENADVTTQETGNSLKEILYEVERLQKTPPAAEELKGIQNYESGLFVLRNSTPGGIVSQLSMLNLHGLPDSYLTEQVKNINAVTPQQVSETARKYVRPEAMTIVVVGDKKIIDTQLKKFQATRKKPL